jgi:hypothetical protein
MRVRITARFQDRESGEYHDPGEVLSLLPERAQGLVAKGCGQIIAEEPRIAAEVAAEQQPKLGRKPRRPPEDKAAQPSEDKELFGE